MITQTGLKAVLYYDPGAGRFVWLTDRRGQIKSGDAAGTPTHNGYVAIKINGKVYGAHRLAFIYMTGTAPVGNVDHANGDRSDNRWSNLRSCTQSQNCANSRLSKANKSGFKGVFYETRRNKWVGRIRIRGRNYHLGQYETAEAAHAAYVDFASKHNGEFARAR
jgi:hypothetical protein